MSYKSQIDDEVVRECHEITNNLNKFLNLPTIKTTYDDIFRGYPELPPQPYEEIIRISDIKKELNISRIETFLLMDEVISLLPNKLLKKLKIYGWRNEHTEFMENQIELWNKISLDNISIKSEDAVKSDIMLILPSNRQLSIVQNNWDRWVWKQKTYNNEYTPTLEGWKKDILEVGEKLANEDIKVHLFCDRDIYQEVIDEFGKTNKIIIREIDIPVGMAKIPYVRDQSVTWYKYPILGNMALDIRIGEEHVISEIYGLIGLRPIHRLRWGMYKDYLLKSKMEGGNFFIVKTDRGTSLLTGIGVRGSNRAAFQILSKILPEDIKLYGLPLSGYIKYWSETGAVHLDVVLLYLGELNGTYYAILDPMRVGFYSLLEYDREKDAFNTISLGEYAKQYGIILEETPRESGSPITLANALNLGNGKLLVDSYNRKMNSFLVKEIGVDIIEVDIPHIEAGGGGPRCITRELWL